MSKIEALDQIDNKLDTEINSLRKQLAQASAEIKGLRAKALSQIDRELSQAHDMLAEIPKAKRSIYEQQALDHISRCYTPLRRLQIANDKA